MTDIVERLRERHGSQYPMPGGQTLFTEAADAIERLDRRLMLAWKTIAERDAEIERLRSANTKNAAADILNHSAYIHDNALELAATMADSKAEKAGDFAPQIRRAAKEIAAAIRTLKETP